MAPYLDTSEFSDSLRQGPYATQFFGLMARIYSKITVFNEDGRKDHGKELLIRVITNHVEQIESPEDREAFFQKAHNVFSAFFGIEYVSPDQLMPQIVALIRKVHGDVAEYVYFDDAPSLRSLQDRVVSAQNTLINAARSRTFDVTVFLDAVFNGEQTISKERLEQYVVTCPDLPDLVKNSLQKFAAGFRGKVIARQNLKGMLNSTLSKSGLTLEEQAVVNKLSGLNSFLESLKVPPDVADFFAHLFLRDSISLEDAQQLLRHTPSTLPAEILTSAFNGQVILDDSFVQLRSREALARALIDSMYADDFVQIVELLMDVSMGHSPIESIRLRTGIGGTPDPIPVRLASYILCSLQISRRFKEQFGVSPKIEFFTGQEGAIACNDVDAQAVRDNTSSAFTFIHSFVDRFFPDVADSFSLVEDHEWESNPHMVMLIDYLEILLRNAIHSDPALATIVEQLESRAVHHGGRDARSALRYAAFHVLCFRDIPTLNHYIESSASEQPMHVISVGGAAEREFDYIRSLLVERFDVERFNAYLILRGASEHMITAQFPPLKTRASMITGTGILPPYYSADPEGDVTIRQLTASGESAQNFVGERVHHALTLSRVGKDSSVIGRAQSVVRGMVLVASVVPPEAFCQFVADLHAAASVQAVAA